MLEYSDMEQEIFDGFIIILVVVFFMLVIPKSKSKNDISKPKSKPKNITRKRDRVKYAYHGLRCYNRGLTSGEYIVVNYLSEKLDIRKYYIFNNLTLATKDGSTQIDHVVVSPYGIFVIETKDYSGWIFGSKEGKVWTQVLPGDNKNTFQNPYRQNYKHIKTLQTYLPFIQTNSFETVIAFARLADFKTVMPNEVKYFDELAYYIQGFDIQTISKAQFFMAIGKLSQLCQSTDIRPEEHITNLQKTHS